MSRHAFYEFLDHLRPEDPEAVGSRRDLARINAWMGNARKLANAVRQPVRLLRERGGNERLRMADIGAGDGKLMLKVASILSREEGLRNVEVLLVDRQPVVAPGLEQKFRELGWVARVVECDVFDWAHDSSAPGLDVCIANLFLHHFEDSELSSFFKSLAGKCKLFAAVEPARTRRAMTLSRMLWLLGCNRITRHDGRVSVQAGFAGRELTALWSASGWQCVEKAVGMASHLFVAQRDHPSGDAVRR